MGPFAVCADFLVAMATDGAVGLLGADIAALHDLPSCRIWQFSRDLDVELQKAREGDIGGEALNTLVWNSVFRSAFRALNLQQTNYINIVFLVI